MNEAGPPKFSRKIIIALIALIGVSLIALFILLNNKNVVGTKKLENKTDQSLTSNQPPKVSKQGLVYKPFDCNSENFPVRISDLEEIAGVPYEITSGEESDIEVICQYAIKQGYSSEFSLIVVSFFPNSPENYQYIKTTNEEISRLTNNKLTLVPGLGDEAWANEGQSDYLIKKGNSFITISFLGESNIGDKVAKLAASRM